MAIRKIILLVLFTLSGLFCAAKSQNTVECKLIDAVRLYTNGEYKKSELILSGITAKFPDNDAAWYYKGMCNLYLQRPGEAKTDIQRAISIDSSNFWYRETLARIYGAEKQTDLTISEYEKLAKDFPKKIDLQYILVNLYLADNQLDKALNAIDNIESVYGKSDPTVMTKYRILIQQKKPEEAYKVLKSYNDEYTSPQVLVMLGDYEMGMYNDSTAISYYDEALRLDKDFPPAKIGKAEVYRLTRKYSDFFCEVYKIFDSNKIKADQKVDYLKVILQNANEGFRKSFQHELDSTFSIAINRHPKDSNILSLAGIYYVVTQRNSLAENIIKKKLDIYPNSKTANMDYLNILLTNKKWQLLVQEAEKAYSKFNKEENFLLIANAGYFNLKDYKSIIKNCDRIINTYPSDTSKTLPVYSTIGDMYHLLGLPKKAFKAYDKALKINPDYFPVLNNYAYYLSEYGKNLKKAYRMSKKVISANPDNATYLDTFGWILHLLGQNKEAKTVFKRAILFGGKGSAVILNHYADVLSDLGEEDSACVYRDMAKMVKDSQNN